MQVGSKFPIETLIVEDANPVREYFDEASGRFGGPSTSSESEDTFQIFLNDAPRQRTSDSDSEDSFIVFEESPGSFHSEKSDSESDSDESDSSSDLENSSSKRMSNFATDSLSAEQSQDEVDCAFVNHESIFEDVDLNVEPTAEKPGLLIDDRKKILRKYSPAKKVQFSEQPPEIHVMRVWSFAARQARKGPWDMYARDRDRFNRRIHHVGQVVSWVFNKEHRHKVVCQRIATWMQFQQKAELQDPKVPESQENLKQDQAFKAIVYDDLKKEEDERRREKEWEVKETQEMLNYEEAMRPEKQKAQHISKLSDDQGIATKSAAKKEEKQKHKWLESLRVLGFGERKAEDVLKPSGDQECVTKKSFNPTAVTKEEKEKLKWEETMRVLGFENWHNKDILKPLKPSDDHHGTKESDKDAKEKLEWEEARRVLNI